ncbi:MAG: hypothetical protein ACP6IP_09720 [Candidatus Njordarchaeia archaeon]
MRVYKIKAVLYNLTNDDSILDYLGFERSSKASFKNTIGVDFLYNTYDVSVNDEEARLELYLWDLDLGESLKNVRIKYLRNSNLAIFAVDDYVSNLKLLVKYILEFLIYYGVGEIVILNESELTDNNLVELEECVRIVPLNVHALDQIINDFLELYLYYNGDPSIMDHTCIIRNLDLLSQRLKMNLFEDITYEDIIYLSQRKESKMLRYNLLYVISRHRADLLTEAVYDERLDEDTRYLIAFMLSLWGEPEVERFYLERLDDEDVEKTKIALERLLYIDEEKYMRLLIAYIKKRKELLKWGLELLNGYLSDFGKREEIKKLIKEYELGDLLKNFSSQE